MNTEDVLWRELEVSNDLLREDDLRQAIAVTEVNKVDATVVTTSSHPPVERDLCASMLSTQDSTRVGPLPSFTEAHDEDPTITALFR